MRMELRRRTGAVIYERYWPVDGQSIEELVAEAKQALAGFYEGDSYCFWPKKKYAPNAPEEVRIIGANGAVVAQYDIGDFRVETNRYLDNAGSH